VYDFLKAFPALAAAFGQGVFEYEARRLVEALKSVTNSHVFVGGGPGSGKTTMALKIVKAFVSDIVNPKGGRVEPDPPADAADAANVPNDGQPAVVDDQSAVDDGQLSADDRVSESDKAAPGFEDATSVIYLDNRGLFAIKRSSFKVFSLLLPFIEPSLQRETKLIRFHQDRYTQISPFHMALRLLAHFNGMFRTNYPAMRDAVCLLRGADSIPIPELQCLPPQLSTI
jgi:hypothetical protein